MINQKITELLRKVAVAYSIKDEKKYRFQIIAYQKAADAIEHLTTEAEELYKEKVLDKLPGIGPSIMSHLEELFKTGEVKHFNDLMKDMPQAVFALLDIPTFGPKKAYKIVSIFNLKNPKTAVKDVKKLAEQGKISNLPGFGEKSEKDILRAIEEYGQGKTKINRMPLPFAFEIAQKVVDYLKESRDVVKIFPLGSLRRMVETVGDIDIAVATNNFEAVINHFVNFPGKSRIIEKGDTSASLILPGGRQVDLMVQKPESFGALLQHFTGSKNHNVHLREHAIKKGFSLSEYGIKRHLPDRTWQMANYKTEEEFYDVLGLDWIPPEIREDTGEIEIALKHQLPKLVELKDVKGDLHTHSSFPIEPSHDSGLNTMEEMLIKAKSYGYEYLGFSEHNPSIGNHASKQIYSLLKRRKENIDQINSSNKYVRVINLLEIDILSNGSLAINDESIDQIDGAIVSIHSSFSMDKDKMTERILEGLSHPKAKILGHPTGRIINERPGYDADWDKIFDYAAKNNKAIEINSWPTRLDLPDSLVREAKDYGVKFVINTDSHQTTQMDNMFYGVSVARRGWCTKENILNALPYVDFMKWLKS